MIMSPLSLALLGLSWRRRSLRLLLLRGSLSGFPRRLQAVLYLLRGGARGKRTSGKNCQKSKDSGRCLSYLLPARVIALFLILQEEVRSLLYNPDSTIHRSYALHLSHSVRIWMRFRRVFDYS